MVKSITTFNRAKIKDNDTGIEEIIETDGVFIAIGHRPNTAFLQGQLKTDKTGYIIVTPGTTETNIPGVFACGDVQDHRYRQAITAARTGCMAALDCEKFLEGNAVHDWGMSEPKKYHALVEDKIFMGGANDVESMIKNEGIEIVVDLRGEAEQPAFSNPAVQWLQIALGDNGTDNQEELFKQAIDEVVEAYKNGKKVAFHCSGGRGRTGAVAAGTHLTLGLSHSLQEAEEKVKEIRPEINIKQGQRQVLNNLFSGENKN